VIKEKSKSFFIELVFWLSSNLHNNLITSSEFFQNQLLI